jgi:hypothetical protein
MLSTGRLPIKRIDQRCCFGSEETMRRSFLRQIAVTPHDYRQRFQRGARIPRLSDPQAEGSDQHEMGNSVGVRGTRMVRTPSSAAPACPKWGDARPRQHRDDIRLSACAAGRLKRAGSGSGSVASMRRNLKPLTDRGLERRPERDDDGRGPSVEIYGAIKLRESAHYCRWSGEPVPRLRALLSPRSERAYNRRC